jgi:uncharacterized protein with PhoU and TrkA domain
VRSARSEAKRLERKPAVIARALARQRILRARRSVEDAAEALARQRILRARRSVEDAAEALAGLTAEDLAKDEQLAIAVKALRSIANYSRADGRSRGLARGALKRLRLGA